MRLAEMWHPPPFLVMVSPITVLGMVATLIAAVITFIIVFRLSEGEATLRREASATLPAATSWEASAETTAATEASAAAHHAEEDFWVDATHTSHAAAHTATTEHVRHVDIITIIVTSPFSETLVSITLNKPEIIRGHLLRVAQVFVSLADVLEPRLRLGITRILVGMVDNSKLPVGLLDLLLVCCLLNPENLVVVLAL